MAQNKDFFIPLKLNYSSHMVSSWSRYLSCNSAGPDCVEFFWALQLLGTKTWLDLITGKTSLSSSCPECQQIPCKDYHPAKHIGMITSHQSPYQECVMASIAVLAFRGCLHLAPRYAGVPEAGCHEGSYFAGCHACGSYTERWEAV